MPYKDPDEQRRYQREWRAQRRSDWLAANGPCVDCGSWTDLEVDHIDRSTKVTHNVWSWAKDRMLAELAKCCVRCRPCHGQRTISQLKELHPLAPHGTHARYAGRGRCRCEACCEAHRQYNRNWKQGRAAATKRPAPATTNRNAPAAAGTGSGA